MLTTDEQQEIDRELQLYPDRRGACIEALQIVQRHRRWISDEVLTDIAAYLGMSPEELENVATFYNLIFRKPVGRHVILFCDSVSCWICGSDRIRGELSATLHISPGETSPDSEFTLLPIQCLGTCDHAPALMIDDDLHRDVRSEDIGDILQKYRSGEEG